MVFAIIKDGVYMYLNMHRFAFTHNSHTRAELVASNIYWHSVHLRWAQMNELGLLVRGYMQLCIVAIFVRKCSFRFIFVLFCVSKEACSFSTRKYTY